MYGVILLAHILSATVWTGGHLVLSLTVLPKAMKLQSPSELLRFESGYERIGIPALLIQVATGVWLAHNMVPDVERWFALDDTVSTQIAVKLALLLLTMAVAAHARLRLIPRLSEDNLVCLARHIVVVTLLSVMFVAVGVSFRTGWF